MLAKSLSRFHGFGKVKNCPLKQDFSRWYGRRLMKEPQNVNQLLQSTNNLNLWSVKGELGRLGNY